MSQLNVDIITDELGTGSPDFPNGVTISTGTIDGTVIGGTTPAAIGGTTGDFSGDLTVDNNASDGVVSIQGGAAGSVNGDARINFISATSASSVAGFANIRVDAPSGGKSDIYVQTAFSGGSLGQKNAMKIDGNNDISFYEDTGTTPKFFWDASAERLGIGTSSPGARLDVAESSAGNGIRITSSDGNQAGIIGTSNESSTNNKLVIHGSRGSGGVIFETNSSEAMRIDSSGNVGMACTSTPVSTGAISGLWYEAGSYLVVARDSAVPLYLNRQTTDGEIIIFRKDGANVGDISITGSSTSYNTSSDERLKENITDADDASDLIDGIQVRQFDWKADGEHQRYGMVAQELDTVAPEAVTKGETEDDMWAVDYSKLVPMLVKEIQDLRKRVAELEMVQ